MNSMKQDIVDEIHRRCVKKFDRRRVVAKFIDELWQCDLVEMINYADENNGFRYILTVIDVFSRFAFAKKLLDKQAKSVALAMEEIFVQQERVPKKIQSDCGKEFMNKIFSSLMRKFDIKHFSSFSYLKVDRNVKHNYSFPLIIFIYRLVLSSVSIAL